MTTVRMPPNSSVGVRRKLLTVVIHDVLPPFPLVGQKVGVILDGEHALQGVVYQRMGFDVFRVELPDQLL